MSKDKVRPVDQANHFGQNEIIVSKTDLQGRIVYANDIFCRVAEMSTADVIGEPHSIIRHPDMPRAVFKLLWDSIAAGKEIFAYVKNMSLTGKYYWVLAHITPSYDQGGQIDGYHSNRRAPSIKAVEAVSALYAALLSEEKKHTNAKVALDSSYTMLTNILTEKNTSYSEFVWSIGK